MPEPPWVLALGTIVTGVGALWLNSRKDLREAHSDARSARRAAYDLDHDIRKDLDQIWDAMISLRSATLAVADSIRTDADLAEKAGDLAAAAAHRVDAARIEMALRFTARPGRPAN